MDVGGLASATCCPVPLSGCSPGERLLGVGARVGGVKVSCDPPLQESNPKVTLGNK